MLYYTYYVTQLYATLSFEDIVSPLIDQVTRPSSCIYELVAEDIIKDKVQLIQSFAIKTDEACAIAKDKCKRIGTKKGFMGKHTCTFLSQSSGGIITKALEGNIQNCEDEIIRMQDQAGTTLEQENIALRAKVTSLEKKIKSLKNQEKSKNISACSQAFSGNIKSVSSCIRLKKATPKVIQMCGQSFFSNKDKLTCIKAAL